MPSLYCVFVMAVLLSVLDGADAAPTAVPFTKIEVGQQSNIDEPREVVVRTAAEWTRLWKQHAGERPGPAVNFSRSTVIGVFLGSRPTAGYGVEITGIEREGGNLIVTYRAQEPDRGAILSQVLTMPYHLVRIDRDIGPVQFKRAAR